MISWVGRCLALVHNSFHGLSSPCAPFSLELYDPILPLELPNSKHRLLTCYVQHNMVSLSFLHSLTLTLFIHVYHNYQIYEVDHPTKALVTIQTYFDQCKLTPLFLTSQNGVEICPFVTKAVETFRLGTKALRWCCGERPCF